MIVKHFKTSADFRKWLEKNHDKVRELWVGFYKKATGKKSITYREALDEALCFGWIDGVKKSVDEISYTLRFTPRRPKSTWSKANIDRIAELRKLDRVTPSGLKSFDDRDEKRSGYSIKDRPLEIEAQYEKKFKANKKAWDFFQAQPPWFRRNTIWWVTMAKQEETRDRRFAKLIEECERKTRLGILSPSKQKK